jgi:hypothetical protein
LLPLFLLLNPSLFCSWCALLKWGWLLHCLTGVDQSILIDHRCHCQNCCRSLPHNQYNRMILNDFVPQLVYYACRLLLYGQNNFFLSFRFNCVSRYVLWVFRSL